MKTIIILALVLVYYIWWRTEKEEDIRLDSASMMTMALSSAGMINNPNVCIKSYGSTVVCVCEPCMKENCEKIRVFMEELEKDLSATPSNKG